ncbi:hypothetical protein DPMN_157705 [Dreissena polymorpha]|uniref:Uncharacterized protein n=1 Tax=Dreissena polymorpha TaxID=45954 RepID=A0A9D4EHP2_DREPO|nr:hypothetical protein DPMN_157705 [Dreissena polymorpha]
MISETSELLNIIKEKTTETPSKTLEIITSGKVDVNLRSSKSETYLHFIAHAYSGDADEAILVPVVFQLSNSGIDMASADADGNTALHVAAKQAGARKLLRALIMIGVDPLQQNQSGHTALQLAKSFPDNAAILTQFSPGLWNAILKNNTGQLNRLMDSWCKINTSKYGQTLIKMAQTSAYTEILDQVNEREKTVEFVHYALAGDRAKLRPFFKMSSVNVNTQTTGYIDGGSGDFITLPLVGEAAMLGLASIVRKLVRKGAHIDVTVRNVPLFLYVMQNTKNNNPFYETLDVILDTTDFKKKNIRKHTYAVLDAAYDRKLPIPTLQIMSANGLDLFALDDDGHFLRDRIMIRYATGSPARLTSELTYLDRILVDMAKNGCLDLLQRFANNVFISAAIYSNSNKTCFSEVLKVYIRYIIFS